MGFLSQGNLEVKSFEDFTSSEKDNTPPPDMGFPGGIPLPTDEPVPEGFETQGFAAPSFPGTVPAMDEEGSAPMADEAAAPVGGIIPETTQSTVIAPGFTIVEQDSALFARDMSPAMGVIDYIGDTSMLLQYLFRLERELGVTLPIQACGVDPIIFDNVEFTKVEGPEGGEPIVTPFFRIPGEGAEDEPTRLYELVMIDGQKFLSCASECLNTEYLHQIISEATTSYMEEGTYIFRMVGLRRLPGGGEDTPGYLLETLRLNTFEMSTLCSYMEGFGVEPSFEVIDGHRCICFRHG